jgi:hypothetical protein
MAVRRSEVLRNDKKIIRSKPLVPRLVDTTPVRSVVARARPEVVSTTPSFVSPDVRHQMIAFSAYLRAERRGFYPGGEVQDWLEAENEVDALLGYGRIRG